MPRTRGIGLRIVGVLAGIAPIIGSAALAAAAPALALALGYDTELALEHPGPC